MPLIIGHPEIANRAAREAKLDIKIEAVDSPKPIESDSVERLPFEAASVMRRPYQIDKLQDTYFVLDDFRRLFEAARTRVA